MYKSSTIESAARYTTAAALYAAIQCAMQDAPEYRDDPECGPARASMIVFTYLLSGAAGSYKVINTRPRLAALLETVRKNWSLFGGGAKPAELAPVRKARAVWPAAMVKLWREQIECREYSDALRIGQEQLGALCFAVTGRPAFMLVAPQQVEGLPAELVSVRRDDGKYTVTDTISGCAIAGRGHATRSGAEGEALALWAGRPEEQHTAALKNARAVQTNKAGADAFAQWAAEHGIEQAIIEQAETAAAEQAETVTDAPQTAEQLRAEFVARGFDVVQVETVREVAADVAPTVLIDAAALPWQILAARPTAVYATPVRRIGSHEWVTVVYAHDDYVACTDQLWRRVSEHEYAFKTARQWPAYDSSRTHSGLPLTLGKLYSEHETEIQQALADVRALRIPVWCAPSVLGTAQRGIESRARSDAMWATVRAARAVDIAITVKAQPVQDAAPFAQRKQVEHAAPPTRADVGQPARQIGAPVPTDADSGRGVRWHKACADAIRTRREFWTLAGRAVYRPWDGRMGALQRTARPPAVRAAGRGTVNPGRFAQPGAVPMRKTRPAARMSGPAQARIDRHSFAGIGFSP